MKTNTIISKVTTVVAVCLLHIGTTKAQIVSINLDGSAPNTNAQLDIKSTGLQGKGLLIPRLTEAQRTSNLAVVGGLLNVLGQLHGGPAQGLVVYQTDGQQGFYYNTSTTSTPTWQYLAPSGSGSAGPTGPTGATGAAGVAEVWLTGASAPTGGQGNVGDWYFRTSNNEILEKTASTTWTSRSTITGATGATGAAGATGATGVAEAWLTGASAPTGGQGNVGDWYFRTSNNEILEKTASTTWTSRATITGATGATGVAEVWHTGSGAPTGGQGAIGDWYFRTSNDEVLEKTGASTWTSRGNLQGATGPTGAAGAAGAAGATGATGTSTAWYSGNGNVGNGQYNVGDWYLRTTTGDVYEKTGSLTWTLRMNIMGPTGATGPTGSGGSGSGWALTGNSISSGNFLGTTNAQSLLFKVNNATAGYLGASDYNAFYGPAIEYGGGGSYNTGIGYDATIYGTVTHSIAIGSGSYVQPGSGSTEDIAIGKGANVSGGSAYSYSMAIGSGAQVQQSNSIAIGKSANVNTSYGIAIGDGAQAQTNAGATAFGRSAYANGANAITLGTSSQAQGSASVSLGAHAWSTMANSISIGGGDASNKTEAAGNYSISLGYKAYSSGTGSISIGGGDASYRTDVSGQYAIGIGYRVYASGQDAIAIGDYARAQANNCMAIGTNIYNGSANTIAMGNSSVTSINLSGATTTSYALQVGTSSSNGNGAYLTKGGVWTNTSDINTKEAFTELNSQEILTKVTNLDITKWKYKGTEEYHIGPMAQDFYSAFNLGGDDKRISTIDPSGVALVAIKALNEKIELQQKLIDELTKKLETVTNKN